jgi:hypothetical protein
MYFLSTTCIQAIKKMWFAVADNVQRNEAGAKRFVFENHRQSKRKDLQNHK